MMADGNNIVPLRSSRETAWRAGLRVIEQAPAGTYGFAEPEPMDRPRVDITGGLDGCTVWLLGKPYVTGLTLSNAARVASALMTLDALDCLPGGETPEPPTAA